MFYLCVVNDIKINSNRYISKFHYYGESNEDFKTCDR